jgi:ABC-type phosphate/phosphonate transport system permease subunit
MKSIVTKFQIKVNGLREIVKEVLKPRRAEGFIDVLIKILITVIIGAALLALLRVAIPDLFQNIIDKIKDTFTI